MAYLSLNNITFSYSNPYQEVFSDLSLQIDTSWRTGLIGRNGYGKSTMLKLIRGILKQDSGSIAVPAEILYLPSFSEWQAFDESADVRQMIRQTVAPFSEWEARMEILIGRSDTEAMDEYGELEQKYATSGGYEIDDRIEREIVKLGFDVGTLQRRFTELSGGEKMRALIAGLFLKQGVYPVLDEPTDHLDIYARAILGEYLSEKDGFLIATHDRNLLDRCADHIVCIRKSDVIVRKGNYSEFVFQEQRIEESERRRDENLKREIKALREEALDRRSWAGSAENRKNGKSDYEGMMDKGYLGAIAARIMKRALHAERRMQRDIEAKEGLLRNKEKTRKLKMPEQSESDGVVLQFDSLTLVRSGKTLVENFSLRMKRGDRIAVTGPNGCGKTSIFQAILGELPIVSGSVHRNSRLRIHYLPQQSEVLKITLRELIESHREDLTEYRNILAALGSTGDILDQRLDTMSAGERKKVDMARSFLSGWDLLLWDEPMNFLDINTREQIEETILRYEPTLLFIEHDVRFIENVATEVLDIDK